MSRFLPFKRAEMSPEKEMLLNRLWLGFAAGTANYFYEYDVKIFSAFLAYLSANAALYIMQRASIWRDEERRFAAIIMDATMGMVVMFCDPEGMSFTYPLFLWMILGNGFRFGLKWLFVAAGLGAAAFGAVVYKTDYWSNNTILGYSLAAGLFIIPAYCSTLIRKLSLAKDQAEIANRAKSYFLASVSHELRTPLNAILGYGNHLRQQDMPKYHHDMIDASVLAGEHLLHLIEQLIQVAKTDTGSATVKMASFKTTDMLSEIRDILIIPAEEKGLSLQIHAETFSDRAIEGPADFVRNILLNLTGNAIKFTESGTVSICGGIQQSGARPVLWFTVSDTGIGIADTALDLIFQPFQQADDTVMNRFGGTGLGLAICKQLVEQVGGNITVESAVGKGSTFRINIPVDFVVDDQSETENDALGIKILSLGHFEPGLLASAQTAGNFSVQYIECDNVAELQTALDTTNLESFQVAMIDQHLANQIEPEAPIWQRFADAEVAPVMVADKNSIDLDDVALRAAFATVIPVCPNFDELRSAIRIGCSFAKHPKFDLPKPRTVPAHVTPRSVLVADDNRTNRNVLAAILETAGHTVTMVTDGDEALEALEKGGIDILLLDVNMPRLSGIEACSMWRQIEGGRTHLPIIGVTADATQETESACLNAGMDLRITKPVNAKNLLAIIAEHCGDNQIQLENLISDPHNVVVPLSTGNTTNAPAIDAAQFEYLGSIGDQTFVNAMIDSFFDDVADTNASIKQAVAHLDVVQFRFCAHAYKSSANNIGAVILSAICGKYEKITEGDFLQNAAIYLDKIEAELLRVEVALRGQSSATLDKTAQQRITLQH
jgi:two-component system, sensor histidine kinase RpfC